MATVLSNMLSTFNPESNFGTVFTIDWAIIQLWFVRRTTPYIARAGWVLSNTERQGYALINFILIRVFQQDVLLYLMLPWG